MQTQLKPWTGSEHLYFYPQSAQIVGQTGQIGRLRIDFGRHGNEFYSTWEDSRLSLKSDKFRQQFDDIINDLRFGDGGRPLAGRKELTEFLRDKQAAILPEDGEWHGFRIDSDEYTALLRCKPSPGDYEAYVWCYKKDWLDEHMANAENGIRFIDSHYQDKFRIRDGDRIRITFPDGETLEKHCRYVDDAHFEMDRGVGPFSLFHICQFAEQMEKSGATVVPIDEPLAVLHERYYCPLSLSVYDRNEYGDLEDEAYGLSGTGAVQYEDQIRELLKKEHSYKGCDPETMASYQDDHKILAVEWDVEEIRGTLYGCIHVDLAAPLTVSEQAELKEWLTGQNSDGFGEGLEQREIELDDGEAYVHFWNPDKYFIKNGTEFRQYLNHDNQSMGGQTL